ncbi:hypothetical protein ABH908_000201 [Pseudomonas frederiksbergensis]|uniref:hypothetical protein n=1 Tax=Pseudomonas TaxID=286 RepID=UPI003D20F5E0
MESDSDFLTNWKPWETCRFNGQVFIIKFDNPLVTGEFCPANMDDPLFKDPDKVNPGALQAIKDMLDQSYAKYLGTRPTVNPLSETRGES